jgi:hypothetical protein
LFFVETPGLDRGGNDSRLEPIILWLRMSRPKPTLLPAPILVEPKGDKDGRREKVTGDKNVRMSRPRPMLLSPAVFIEPKGDKDSWAEKVAGNKNVRTSPPSRPAGLYPTVLIKPEGNKDSRC